MELETLLNHAPSPIEELTIPVARRKGVRLFIKRDDLLVLPAYGGDEAFSGNKWRKLKYNLLAARTGGQNRLLTFGGAYSNHLAATASAGKLFGFETVGIVRGEEIGDDNPTLSHCRRCDMQLEFVSRADYRLKTNPYTIQKLRKRFGAFFLLPEGGTNTLALRSCSEWADEIAAQWPAETMPDYICLSCGTGGSMAGLVRGLRGRSIALGFPALKGSFLRGEIEHMLRGKPAYGRAWEFEEAYHFGGYARFDERLIDFINAFYGEHGIALD
ncbi:MAG: pyridoxal-phosphate dependent enzyme, partial [Saprospiraceae bacterium]|nr:pyridoxal-phosphate dependent enzyme [Saprospiraceae bacterium]